MPEPTRSPLAWVHDAILAGLVATAPLSWDEDPTQPWVLIRHVVLLVGLAGLLVEALGGWRTSWRISARAVLAAAFLALIGIAAVRSPLPLQGWGLAVEAAADGLLGWYLLQVVPTREGIAGAALGAGLFAELMIALLQRVWVLPRLAQASDATFGVAGSLLWQVRERIRNGGVFGTFTQANALAGYLLVAAPPVLIGLWRSGGARRIAAVVVAVAAGATAVLTASKGAYLAAGGALAILWWARRWRWRWLAPIGVGLAVAAALCVIPLRGGLSTSTEVRLGYWQAATSLVRTHPLLGTGLAGYRADAEAVLPRWAGYSVHVHDEPLEAAAEAGIAAGILLLALLVLWPLGRPGAPAVEPVRLGWLPPLAAAGLTWYGCAFDMLTTNVGWWPGSGILVGGLPLVAMLWWLAVAAVVAIGCQWCARTVAPGWVYAAALAALGLHCLVDYDLHAGGVVETAVVVAVLAGGTTRAIGAAAATTGRMRPTAFVPALLATLAIGAGLWWWAGICGRDRAAAALEESVEAVFRPPKDGKAEALRDLAQEFGPEADGLAPAALVGGAIDRAFSLAEEDYPLRLHLLAVLPASAARAQRSQPLAAAWPMGAAAQWILAQDEEAQARALGDAPEAAAHWHAALDAAARAVADGPWNLRIRRAVVGLERAAAAGLPGERAALLRRADTDDAEINRLSPLVNWSNR